MYFYGLQNFFFLLIMIAMLNSGHIDIYTVYKQCLEKCSSKVISTIRHKCSVFQLFTDQLAHNILGCDNRVCKLSVSFAGLELSSQRLSAGSPHQAVACVGLCVSSLSGVGSRGKPHRPRTELTGPFRTGQFIQAGCGNSVQSFSALGSSLWKQGKTLSLRCVPEFRNLLDGSSWSWPWVSSPSPSSSTT